MALPTHRNDTHNITPETLSLWSFLNDPIGFLSDVEHGDTRIILTLDNKALGAIVPVRDLQQLEDNNPE